MKMRLVRGIVAAAIIAAVSGISSPASAHMQVCVGQGSASTPKLFYPGVGPAATGPFALALTVGACVPAGPAAASGNLTGLTPGGGYCGHSTGTGTFNGHAFSYVSAGSLLVMYGGGVLLTPVTGVLTVGVANAVPNLTTTPPQSCVSGATNFLVSGAVATVVYP